MGLTSLYAGLSGLNAHAFQLSVIGNNLANINTPGYKASSAAFEDLLSQTLTGGSSAGSINFLQVGLGVQVGGTNQNFSQGSLQTTGNVSDVAIQGNGFFIVQGDQSLNYTRAGNFHVDANGNLVTTEGAHVQGYTQKDPVTNSIISTGALGDINIHPGTLYPPLATSTAKMVANLDSNATAGSTFTSSSRVFDSLGSAHELDFTWTKTGTGQYSYDVTIDGGDVAGGTAGTPKSLLAAPGTMTFDTDGNLTLVNGAAAANVSVTSPAFTNGASPLTFSWEVLDPNGNSIITNYATPSATASSSQNGFAAGTLNSFIIGADGAVQGLFSNGKAAELARIALASFNNPSGLLKVGGNKFNLSSASGEASVGVPGEGGRGTTTGSTLELSNVDMASEFINMIVAQRGYQANSRVITTTDEILQESLNLKR
jgi:flagellar hook protein FlgE